MADEARRAEAAHTFFQTAARWSPRLDSQADVAIVYGATDNFFDRVDSWRDQGYRIEYMTGSAWGGYQDYVQGDFDGSPHRDEGQVAADGKPCMHGPTVPYFVPSPPYREYLKTHVHRAIDAGAEAIHLEEPEFWAFAGYSEAFRRAWKERYGEPWQRPDSSVSARYKASRLMLKLYYDTLDDVFADAKEYARRQGREVQCFVPTHSLVNYAHWRIVSPMSSLMRIPHVDGYIAQVWTGTARTPAEYRGRKAERVFETAFLEYAQMLSMVRPTGRACLLLADPVEDNPNFGWDDYEDNYRRVLVASLLQPEARQFEIMPWPHRIFTGAYFPTNEAAARRDDADPPARIGIPPHYAAVLQVCFNALAEIGAVDAGNLQWDAGASRLGVLVSDTLMFQRDKPAASDSDLANFFGMALPLLKHGALVEIAQMETIRAPADLGSLDLLVVAYDGMKPLDPEFHDRLAAWVRERGGSLLLLDGGADDYDELDEWWNRLPQPARPAVHLARTLEVAAAEAGKAVACGEGWFLKLEVSPTALAGDPHGDARLRAAVHALLDASGRGEAWHEQNHLALRRGPYVAAACMAESAADAAPLRLEGRLVDLFDPQLAVRIDPEVTPGEVGLFRDVDYSDEPTVLACAARVRDLRTSPGRVDFRVRGQAQTRCVLRLRLPGPPTSSVVTVAEDSHAHPHQIAWESDSGTALMEFENIAKDLEITCTW